MWLNRPIHDNEARLLWFVSQTGDNYNIIKTNMSLHIQKDLWCNVYTCSYRDERIDKQYDLGLK